MGCAWYGMVLCLSLCLISRGKPEAYDGWRGERNPYGDGSSPGPKYPDLAYNEPTTGRDRGQMELDNTYGKQQQRRNWFDINGDLITKEECRSQIQKASVKNVAARWFGIAPQREYGTFGRPPPRRPDGGMQYYPRGGGIGSSSRQYDVFDRPPPRQYDAFDRPPPRQYDVFDRPPPRRYDVFDRPPPRQYDVFDRPPPGQYDVFNRPPPRHYDGGVRPPPRQYGIFDRPPLRNNNFAKRTSPKVYGIYEE